MYSKCHTVNFICIGSYVDSPVSVEKKRKTINPKNPDIKCKCFQYAAVVAYVQLISQKLIWIVKNK